MKNTLFCSACTISLMLLVPLMAFSNKGDTKESTKTQAGISDAAYTAYAPTYYNEFRLKNIETGSITILKADEYIAGVVSAEMPALYETEALKAQAVAAYTFACYKADSRKKEPYDVTTDSHIDQSFTSDESLKSVWGENYEKYKKKIKEAVASVAGEILTYNGKTALSVYHAISSGTTNCCKDVWSKDIAYLRSVDSSGDKTASKYINTVSFTPKELSEKLKKSVICSGKESEYLGKTEKTESGLVKSVNICGKTVSGSDISSALELRSGSFDAEFKDNLYVFTTYGYGHGVGMSQNGANYMAKQGSSYKEILLHYYKGCSITKR